MKRIFTYIGLIILLISCRNIEKELSISNQKYNEIDSLYKIKKVEYDTKLQLLENCLNKEKNINSDKREDNSKKIKSLGLWNTPSEFGGGVLELIKEDNTYYKIEIFPDGSKSKLKMDMNTQGNNKIFKLSERNSNDRWIVYPNGILQVVDKQGVIYSQNKLL